MLPKSVFEHMKFGNGAQPGASCVLDNGSEIIVSRHTTITHDYCTGKETRDTHIVAMRYTLQPFTSEYIDLRDCPEQGNWKTYWTCEA